MQRPSQPLVSFIFLNKRQNAHIFAHLNLFLLEEEEALTGGNVSGVALGSLSPAYTALEQGIGEDGGLGDDGGQHHGAFAEAMSVFISHRTHQVVDSHCSLSLSLSLSLALSIPPSPPPRSHASLSTLYLPYWTFNCAEITKAKKHQ